MSHIKQTTSNTDHSCAVDGVNVPFDTPVELSAGGFGVVNQDGTFEILDALPGNNPKYRKSLGITEADNSDAGAATVVSVMDKLTSTEESDLYNAADTAPYVE